MHMVPTCLLALNRGQLTCNAYTAPCLLGNLYFYMIGLALLEPEIPQNTGTLIRLSACFMTELHIIMPCGFLFDDKRILRSSMVYRESANITVHDSFEKFCINTENRRIICVSPRVGQAFNEFAYQDNDILLLGKESTGTPLSIQQQFDHSIHIPIQKGMDSLNLAISGAIVLSESMRRLNLFKRLL